MVRQRFGYRLATIVGTLHHDAAIPIVEWAERESRLSATLRFWPGPTRPLGRLHGLDERVPLASLRRRWGRR
jgi:hypothetical protein